MKNIYKTFILTIVFVLSGVIFPITAFGSVKPTSVTPSCGFSQQKGRTIVEFNAGKKKLFANDGEDHAMMQASTTILAGTYNIALVSYDGYSSRASTATSTQLEESWFAILKNNNSEIARTSAIGDLEDGVAYVSSMEQVGTNFVIPLDVNSVIAYHAAYATTTTNSVVPICAVFDKVVTTNTKPTITLTATSTTITVGDVFNPLSGFATANDKEEGDITSSITASSTVATSTPGIYKVDYSVSDSKGLKADTKTLTVVVEKVPEKCTDTVMAKITIDNVKNWQGKKGNVADMTDSIYLGSSTTPIKSGEWFSLYKNGAYINDPDIMSAGYENVPGLAVERINGTVRVLMYGSHPNDGTKEHVDGKIEFSGTNLKGFRSDDSGNNRLENNSDSLMTYSAGQDEVWSKDGVNNFWLTVTVANDGFFADYKKPFLCPVTTNTKPTITLTATSTTITVGDVFNPLSGFATANDKEEGDITSSITASSTVATSTPGIYKVDYSVSDSKGLKADTKTLTVVVERKTMVKNTKPTITLLGDKTIAITQGDVFTDPGVTANDAQDGDITTGVVVGGDNVDVNKIGTYTITYNVSDKGGLSASEVTRIITVNAKKVTPPVCTNCGGGNGGGGSTVVPLSVGGGPIMQSLRIFNEKLELLPTGDVFVSWETDKPSTSRVVYDDISHKTTTYATNIGYASSTQKVSILVKKHKMLITGLLPDTQYFFRPISVNGSTTKIGNEKTFAIPVKNVTNTSNLASAGECSAYIKDYLRIGDDNDAGEVRKLQEFLKNSEGFSGLKITGVFGQATYDAVVSFQEKYKKDILTPWGITDPTGYVYYTTQKKINEISCGKDFNLTQSQKSEISRTNLLINKLRKEGRVNEVDVNTLGRANTTQPKGKTKATGLAVANSAKKVENSKNGQIAAVVGSVSGNNFSKDSTTTKSVLKSGILASVFGSIKSGISSVIDSIKRFFTGNSSKEEYVEVGVDKNVLVGTSTVSTNDTGE